MEADKTNMQAVTEINAESQTTTNISQWLVSIEVLAYLSLAIFALLIRVANIDSVPLTEIEAQQALSAWHTVQPEAPGSPVIANSPLTYWSQVIAFSILGPSEFATRIGVVLAGFALTLVPMLFRERIGRTRAFVWSLLLTVLTTPLVVSRYADGTIWTMLFATLLVWALWRYWYSSKLADAMLATVFLTFMVLLSSPGGIPLLVILLVAGWLAVWRTALSAPERLDLPGDDILKMALRRMNEFPVTKVAFLPLLIIVIVATGFMLNPSGMSTVGQLIQESLAGISRPPADAPNVRLGFLTLISYEPLLILFALGSAWLLWKRGDMIYVDRFAVAWAALGALGLVLYTGASASYALWVVVPLTMLASYGITELMVNRLVIILWTSDDDDDDLYTMRYWWMKWIIAVGVFVLTIIVSLHFHEIARALTQLPPNVSLSEAINMLLQPQFADFRYSGIWFVISIVFTFVGFFLVASFWTNEITLQGLGLGLFFYLVMSGLGGGWTAAVVNADKPDELWHPNATAMESMLLRETLFEIANRQSGGFPFYPIRVVTDEAGIITNDAMIAWLLRDFKDVEFVSKGTAVQGGEIILMAQSSVNDPDLGGDYVGQSFVLQRTWNVNYLYPFDIVAWWSMKRFRLDQQSEEIAILWLRQDIFNGIPTSQRPQ